jgi:hypothetical protein
MFFPSIFESLMKNRELKSGNWRKYVFEQTPGADNPGKRRKIKLEPDEKAMGSLKGICRFRGRVGQGLSTNITQSQSMA